MLLHDSRREARLDEDGNLVVLEDQDRSLWNRDQIAEGVAIHTVDECTRGIVRTAEGQDQRRCHNGGAGHQQMDYEPSYIIRGLDSLHLKLDPR